MWVSPATAAAIVRNVAVSVAGAVLDCSCDPRVGTMDGEERLRLLGYSQRPETARARRGRGMAGPLASSDDEPARLTKPNCPLLFLARERAKRVFLYQFTEVSSSVSLAAIANPNFRCG